MSRNTDCTFNGGCCRSKRRTAAQSHWPCMALTSKDMDDFQQEQLESHLAQDVMISCLLQACDEANLQLKNEFDTETEISFCCDRQHLLIMLKGLTPHSPFSSRIFSKLATLSVGGVSNNVCLTSVAACKRCTQRFSAWKHCDRPCCSHWAWPELDPFCRAEREAVSL